MHAGPGLFLHATLGLVLCLATPIFAHAQETATSEAPQPEAADVADPGPGLAEPTPARARAPETDEPPESILETSILVISLGIFTGSPQKGELDAALNNFGYSPNDVFWGFDLSVERRITGLLWLGARGDFRMRQWGMRGGASADAFGPSLLAILGLRIPLNRALDVGGVVGAGFGAAIVSVRETADVTGLPRLSAGLQLGVSLFSGLRAHMGATFDYAESLSLNDDGHSVSFSIAAFRFGLEGRL